MTELDDEWAGFAPPTANPEDMEFMQYAGQFLAHVATCPNCFITARDNSDGVKYVEGLFNGINRHTHDRIELHDYNTAIAFCHYWLTLFGSKLELPTESDKPSTKH